MAPSFSVASAMTECTRNNPAREQHSTAHPVVEYAGLEVGRGLSQRRPTVAAVLALAIAVWEPAAIACVN